MKYLRSTVFLVLEALPKSRALFLDSFRLQVNLQECERKQLNYGANKNIIKKYGGVEL